MVVAVVSVVLAGWAGETAGRPRITGISHVRIRVSAYCRALDFYSEMLGERPHCGASKQVAESVGGSLVLWSGQFITLNVHSLYGPTPYRKSMLEEVGFLTDDAAALRQYLQSRGVEVRELSGAQPSFVVYDPEGYLIEFIEHSLPPVEKRPDVPTFRQSRIIHAGFVVKDRAAMDHFYKDILGFRLHWQGGMKDGETDWVAMQVPDGTDWIEYMLNVNPKADKQELGVMNHISLGVVSVKAAAEQLEKAGVKLPEPPQMGRDGKWQLNLYDPDWTRAELMEFTPVEKPCCAEFTGPHPKP